MIKLQELTPQVYYERSRDFQFIGRLYDLVLNSVKTNTDVIYELPNGKNIDGVLLNLLALSLGFKAKHHYNALQLRAVCSVLPTILRQKGSLGSILTAVNALLCAEGIDQPLDYSIISKEKIILYLPTQLDDLTLLYDMLTYILPAGMSCEMIKEISELNPIVTPVGVSDFAAAHTITSIGTPDLLSNMTSGITRFATGSELNAADAGTTSGLMANSTVQNAMTLPVISETPEPHLTAEIQPDQVMGN